ncbi:GNAT family N-acetyltransferase [Faucicola mancuniensis]
MSAQTYLKGFYESLGFRQQGKGCLEDNIPHIDMLKMC